MELKEMISAIRPIETSYKGYRFRSRLEARWAVFFDHAGIRWEYEPEGFPIREMNGERTWSYLPDFHLTDLGTWVEVKGSLDAVDDDYLEMIAQSIDWYGQIPDVADSACTPRGLLWLGPIPEPAHTVPVHLILQHSKGGWCNLGHFHRATFTVVNSGGCGDSEYFDTSWGSGCPEILRKAMTKYVYGSPYYFTNRPTDPDIIAAYRAARSARFEHGQKGVPWR
jgi:hypothetical protein